MFTRPGGYFCPRHLPLLSIVSVAARPASRRRRRPRRRQAAFPGHGARGQRDGHRSRRARRRSCRCHRPPPRCSMRSARAARSRRSTNTRTTRRAPRAPTSTATTRTSRRSRPTSRTSSWCPGRAPGVDQQLGALGIPVSERPGRRQPDPGVRAVRRARQGDRARGPGAAPRWRRSRARSPHRGLRPQAGASGHLLLRARPDLLLGDVEHLHRAGARAARPAQHRRRGQGRRGERGLSAAER